jgi:copper(I)-binding protein
MDRIMRPLRTFSTLVLAGALVLTLAAAVSCGGDEDTGTEAVKVGDLEITDAYARVVMDGGAAYFTIKNTGSADDALVGAASDVAGKVALHESVGDGTTMTMRPVEEIAIPAGGEAILEPGGYHVMLTDLKQPLEEGDTFKVTLTFKEAGSVDMDVTVRAFTESDDGMDGTMESGETPPAAGTP